MQTSAPTPGTPQRGAHHHEGQAPQSAGPALLLKSYVLVCPDPGDTSSPGPGDISSPGPGDTCSPSLGDTCSPSLGSINSLSAGSTSGVTAAQETVWHSRLGCAGRHQPRTIAKPTGNRHGQRCPCCGPRSGPRFRAPGPFFFFLSSWSVPAGGLPVAPHSGVWVALHTGVGVPHRTGVGQSAPALHTGLTQPRWGW